MKVCRLLLVLSSFIVSGVTAADKNARPSFEYAKDIRAVWELSSQPCNSGIGNAMNRHPNSEEIINTKSVLIPDIGFRFGVPQLPLAEETVIKVFLNDTSRGVTDHYFLLSDQDLEPPFASVVVTELPEDMRNIDKAFAAVKTLQARNLQGLGVEHKLTQINGPHGESLEMLIHGRVGSHCFPTARVALLPPGIDVRTIGVSRFSLIDSKLVEFSLIIVIPETIEASASEDYARKIMDSFWQIIESI